jgi:hypothetical protein
MNKAELYRQLDELREHNRAVYYQRNCCVALLSLLAFDKGMAVGLAWDESPDCPKGWNRIVIIDLPTGQISYHIPNQDLWLFGSIPNYPGKWDMHNNQVKNKRIEQLILNK